MAGKRASVVLLALGAALGLAAPAAAKAPRHRHSHAAPAHAARTSLTPASDGGALYVSSAPASASGAGPILAAGGGISAPGVATGPTGPSGVAVGGASAGSHPPAVKPTSGPTGPTGATGSTGTATIPGSVAEILPDGLAVAPAGAPAVVKEVIAAGNQLIGQPYVYGGGHASFISNGYDCSGAVSYALHGGDLLSAPLDSTAFETWGLAGAGTWITVFTNPTHAYMDVAGIRFDTSTAGDPGGKSGPRWRPLLSSNAGFFQRHPAGF